MGHSMVLFRCVCGHRDLREFTGRAEEFFAAKNEELWAMDEQCPSCRHQTLSALRLFSGYLAVDDGNHSVVVLCPECSYPEVVYSMKEIDRVITQPCVDCGEQTGFRADLPRDYLLVRESCGSSE